MATKGSVGNFPLLANEKFQPGTSTVGVILSLYFGMGLIAKPLLGLVYNRFGARSAVLIPMFFMGCSPES